MDVEVLGVKSKPAVVGLVQFKDFFGLRTAAKALTAVVFCGVVGMLSNAKGEEGVGVTGCCWLGATVAVGDKGDCCCWWL